SWEQLRRCPWAFRLVKGGHPLGLPSGYLIPQPVLASGIFQNSKREATEWFHDPDKLGEWCRHQHVRRRKTVMKPVFNLTSRAMQLFEEHAPAIFRQIIAASSLRSPTEGRPHPSGGSPQGSASGSEYPKFAGFEVNEAGFRCRFYNGPGDKNPSSFCEG